MNNFKTQLKEYAQKTKKTSPIYNTVYSNNHWKSSIIFDNKTYEYNGFYENKILAEQNIAKIVCKDLNLIVQSSMDTSLINAVNPTIIVVDLENIQPNSYYNFNQGNISIIYFVSTFSTIDTSKYQNGSIMLIDSAYPNAVDHYMTYYVGAQIENWKKIDKLHFVVVSRDRSSAIIEYIVKSQNITTTHIKSSVELDNFLSKIKN